MFKLAVNVSRRSLKCQMVPRPSMRMAYLSSTQMKLGTPDEIKKASSKSDSTLKEQSSEQTAALDEDVLDKSSSEELPWYLREEESSELSTPIFKAQKPVIPEGVPEYIEPSIDHIINKLGLDNIKIFDVRDRDLPISSMSDIMVICSGKSTKHLQKATEEMTRFMKNELGKFPTVEGFLKQNSLIRQKRRLKRRAKLRSSSTDYEYGIGTNSWVVIKLKNVSFHFLTPERRAEMNLEYLWCEEEEKEFYKPKKPLGLKGSDSIFDGLFKRFYSTRASDRLGLEEAAVQQLLINDVPSFDDISPQIRENTEIATKTLDRIYQEIQNSKLSEILETSSRNDNRYVYFTMKSFPILPTKQNWNQLFDIFALLNSVSEKIFPLGKLKEVLLLQASSGEFIDRDQLVKFIEKITGSAQLNIMEKQPKSIVNKTSKLKFAELFDVLKVVDYQSTIELDDEIKLSLLRLATQQHLFEKETNLDVSRQFKFLVDFLYSSTRPSNEAIQFIITTYLKSMDTRLLFEFWESLKRFFQKDPENLIKIDNRPWAILIEGVNKSGSDIDVERLLNHQMKYFSVYEIHVTREMKKSLSELLKRADSKKYPEINRLIQ